MAGLSISNAWDEAREILVRNGRLFVAVALSLIVLPQIVAGVVAPAGPAGAGSALILLIAAGLLGLVAQLAIVRLTVGDRVSVGEAIGHGFRRFPILLLAMFLLGLLYALLLIPIAILAASMGVAVPESGAQPTGGFALLVGGIILLFIAVWPRFSLIPPVASEERVGPIRIIRRSWELTKGNYLRFLGLMLLIILLALVLLLPTGLIGGLLGKLISPELEPLSLGAFVMAFIGSIAQGVFSVIVSALLARIYLQVAGAGAGAEVSVPASRD